MARVDDLGASGVIRWWISLAVVAVVNLALWLRLARRRPPARRRQLLLSAGFVLGCAFRSFFPRADVQRICLQDSWLSAVALGRSVATVAELCLALQWALLLREWGAGARSTPVIALMRCSD